MSQNKDILEPNKEHPYLFTSDSELNSERSDKKQNIISSLFSPKETYTPIFGSHEEAKESLSSKEIDVALNTAIEYEKNLEQSKSKTNSQRNKFLAELSNNGKYKNIAPNINSNNSREENKNLSNDNMER